MPRTCLAGSRVLAATFCLCVFLASPLLAQRSDRAIISGVVTDAQGAAVPGRHGHHPQRRHGRRDRPGHQRRRAPTRSAAAGARPLHGHRRSPGLQEGGRARRILLAGRRRRSVTTSRCRSARSPRRSRSSAASGLDDTTPDVSHTVDEKVLPRAADRHRRATCGSPNRCCRCSPATCRCGPTATRCSAAASSTPASTAARRWPPRTSSTARRSGTRSATSRATRARRRSSRVQEMKVITTTYSAQYGHTSGGFIEYTSKSGTNEFHGSGYEYFADDALNANGIFSEQAGSARRRSRNNNFGVHAGRPGRAPEATTAATRRSSSRTSTTRASARARCPASATRRRSTRSRTATSARC